MGILLAPAILFHLFMFFQGVMFCARRLKEYKSRLLTSLSLVCLTALCLLSGLIYLDMIYQGYSGSNIGGHRVTIDLSYGVNSIIYTVFTSFLFWMCYFTKKKIAVWLCFLCAYLVMCPFSTIFLSIDLARYFSDLYQITFSY